MRLEPLDPFAKPELEEILVKVQGEVADYFAALPERVFFVRPEGAWSPAENVVHLIKSVRPVAMGLRLPRLMLKLFFGTPQKPSRRFQHLKEDYRAELGKGAKAPKRFVPREREAPANPAASRLELLRRWQAAGTDLLAALRHWHETELDRFALPHPLLGKLTIREMIFFTLYHDLHHVNNVRRRLGQKVLAV